MMAMMIRRATSPVVLNLFLAWAIWFKSVSNAELGPNVCNVSAVLAFGDSILDTGNNNDILGCSTKANFPPYGVNFPGAVPTGRFGNGKVFSDVMTEALGVKDALPAFRNPALPSEALPTGVCFASAGSGLDDMVCALQHVITVREQLNDFQTYLTRLKAAVGEEKAKCILSQAVALVSLGNNDIAIMYYGVPSRAYQYDIDTYTTTLVSKMPAFIEELYAAGLRRFAFLGVLPLGCLPGARSACGTGLLACCEHMNRGSRLYNSKIQALLTQMKASHPGSKFVYVDVYTPLLDISNNPRKYGFGEAVRGCCGIGGSELSFACNKFNPFTCKNPPDHVYWDAGHPTEGAYRIAVSQIIENVRKDLLAS